MDSHSRPACPEFGNKGRTSARWHARRTPPDASPWAHCSAGSGQRALAGMPLLVGAILGANHGAPGQTPVNGREAHITFHQRWSTAGNAHERRLATCGSERLRVRVPVDRHLARGRRRCGEPRVGGVRPWGRIGSFLMTAVTFQPLQIRCRRLAFVRGRERTATDSRLAGHQLRNTTASGHDLANCESEGWPSTWS